MDYDAIIFDLGNTLVPWTEQESRALYAGLHKAFEQLCGPLPDFFERAARARGELVDRRADTTMREVTVAEFVDHICAGETPEGLYEAVAETTHRTFLELARVPDRLPGLLDTLRKKKKLAVLSNFYMTSPIEDLLDRTGLAEKFVHVEVSATAGFVKPHPAPFDTVRNALDTPRESILMVGDNFWADIVGGHRAGLLTALTTEHHQGPTSDPRAPEVAADRVLKSLAELLEDL